MGTVQQVACPESSVRTAMSAAKGLGRLATGKEGCENIFEILAGLAKGNYSC